MSRGDATAMTMTADRSAALDPSAGLPRLILPIPSFPLADLPRRERRDAAANRRRILAAAKALFAERGVDAVSMHEIAQAAGVGQGTLYRRFEHKGQLCAALLEDALQHFHEKLQARFDAAPTEPFLDRLDFVLTILLGQMEAHAALIGAMVDAACGERRGMFYDSPFYAWLHRVVAVLVEGAAAAGEIRAIDADCAADAILAPFDIDLYFFQRRQRGLTHAQIMATLRRLLFDGLRGAPTDGVVPRP